MKSKRINTSASGDKFQLIIVMASIQARQVQECKAIRFIDCRGWYDLGVEILCLCVAIFLIINVIITFRNLLNQRDSQNQLQYQKSIRRQLILSAIQIAYLATFIASVSFQIGAFVLLSLNNQIQYVKENLQIPSKILEAAYIDALNFLNLTVGVLYWKATRGYYVFSELPIPFLYRKSIQIVFLVFYSLNLSAFIVALVHFYANLLFGSSIEIFTLISTTASIAFCIVWRFMYRKKILKAIQLTGKAIRKQNICSFLLFFSSFCRIALYTFQAVVPGWAKNVRNYQQPNICIDLSPVYAICIFFLHLVINLLPSSIYYYLFRVKSSKKWSKNFKRIEENILQPSHSEEGIQSKMDSLLKDSTQLISKKFKIIKS